MHSGYSELNGISFGSENRKEISYLDHIPFNLKGNRIQIFSVHIIFCMYILCPFCLHSVSIPCPYPFPACFFIASCSATSGEMPITFHVNNRKVYTYIYIYIYANNMESTRHAFPVIAVQMGKFTWDISRASLRDPLNPSMP